MLFLQDFDRPEEMKNVHVLNILPPHSSPLKYPPPVCHFRPHLASVNYVATIGKNFDEKEIMKNLWGMNFRLSQIAGFML